MLGPSGASAHLRGIAEALRPIAVVTAVASDHRGIHGEIVAPIIETGVPGWPSWLASRRDHREVWAARRVATAAANMAPDLVWERYSLFSDAGRRVMSATGCRWILEVNAPLVDERLRYEEVRRLAWARGWEKDVLRSAPEIIAVSGWLTEWLRDLGCRNVRHVPNGVADIVGDRDATRARLGISDRFVVGFLGSMKPWHGVHRMAAVLDAIPDAVALIVGEGPVALTHPRCINVGQVGEAEAADLVAAMDVGLAPYAADAPPWFCPLKVLAYRAQGTPVVATAIGDCHAMTGSGGTVLLARASDDDLISACLAWRGRRAARTVRTWREVVREAVG